jgi:hypothetical protein
MTFRHAAALALVVWYLMLPPGDGAEVTIHAPLSRWKIDGSYDSARKGQKQIDILKTFPLAPGQNLDRTARSADPNVGQTYAIERELWNGVCVSTDDPRLKSK